MKQRVLSVLAAASMILSLIPVTAWAAGPEDVSRIEEIFEPLPEEAEDASTSVPGAPENREEPSLPDGNPMAGTCGINVTWSLDEAGTLIISGTGDMENYTLNNTHSPWYSVRTNVIAVKIEYGVTSIGAFAFYGCRNLATVSIPDGITDIGKYAFYDCRSIADITIPTGIVRIGTAAFWGCGSLKKMTVPDSVASIGDAAFQGCSGLTEIRLSNALTSIEYNTFIGCSSLAAIDIPDSIAYIGHNAFESCTSLTSIVIPDSVTEIGSMAFSGCSALTYICVPGSVTAIGSWAFAKCGGLKSAGPIGGGYDYEFGWTTTIPSNAFHVCSSLTQVVIPAPISSISSEAAKGCSSVNSVYIPSTVANIGGYAFSSWNNLSDVYYGGTEEQWGNISVGRDNEALSRATIHYNCTEPEPGTDMRIKQIILPYDAWLGESGRNISMKWGWGLFQKSAIKNSIDECKQDTSLAIAGLILSRATQLSAWDAENLLLNDQYLGFDKVDSKNYDQDIYQKPAVTFACKRLNVDGVEQFVFAIAVRGTSNIMDGLTDLSSLWGGWKLPQTTSMDSLEHLWDKPTFLIRIFQSEAAGGSNSLLPVIVWAAQPRTS